MKKMNKTFKRIAIITSASILAACAMMPMALNTFAAVNDFTLSAPANLPADSTISNIMAYKIFDCELTDSGAFNVIAWATGVTPESLGFAAGTSAADAAVAINATDYDIDALAKKAATVLTANGIEAVSYADSKVKFEQDLAIGYYVVVCDVISASGTPYDAKSLGMLTVTGRGSDIQIGTGTAKVGLPTVQKKVKEDQSGNYATDLAKHETTDKSWNDVADYDIGDAVPFKLYGTMPQNLDKYNAYYYCFKDTLASQFTAPDESSVVVKIDGNTVTEGNNMRILVDGQNLTVSFEDIKKAVEGVTVTKDSIVTIEYSAVLNSTAVVGNTGQNNKVKLEYSNNPNFDYKPSINDDTPDSPGNENTGETPEDIVNVLTYAFKFNKTFFNAAGGPLTPAEVTEGVYDDARFSLSKGGSELYFLPSTDSAYDYVLAKEGEKVTIGGTEYTATNRLELTLKDTDLVIRVKGLDEGAYTLKEEVVPTGFNKAPDQTIEIIAGSKNGQSWNGTDKTLESFSWTIDGTAAGNQSGNAIDATATAEMQNRQGTSLPGTGGIGTTIFYLGGGAMAAIGGIYLISKRRMKKSEE